MQVVRFEGKLPFPLSRLPGSALDHLLCFPEVVDCFHTISLKYMCTESVQLV